MAIGRCFQEALQKGLCSLEQGFNGLDSVFKSALDRYVTILTKQNVVFLL